MKRYQKTTLQFNLKDHDFVITLQSIKCTKEMQGIFTLELQKGCRHLKSLNEAIQFDKNRKYLFQEGKPMTVRAYKQKNMIFSWSLYKLIDDKYQFVENFNANFQDNYLRFLDELRNSSFQYMRICQQRDEGQPLGHSWKLMKLHLKGHQFKQTIKSSSGNLTLQFKVDIRNEFDMMTEAEQLKSKKKVENEDQRTTSSKNQLKDKKKFKLIEEQKQKQSQLRLQSLIKSEQPDQEHNQQKSKQTIIQQEYQPYTKISYPPFLSIQQTFSKPKTILSDIIQASNEGESHLNPGNKSDRKPSQSLLQIPQAVKPFSKTKTYHFEDSDKSEPVMIKRMSSHDDMRMNHKEEENELLRVSQVSEVSKDELTKESTVIIHQEPQVKPIEKQVVQSNSKKYVLIVLVVYIIFGGLLFSQIKGNIAIQKQFSRKNKIKKGRLSIDKLLFSFN